MRGLTLEQIIILAVLAVGLLVRVLRSWDARRRQGEPVPPDETTPAPRRETARAPYPVGPPLPRVPRTVPVPPPSSPRPRPVAAPHPPKADNMPASALASPRPATRTEGGRAAWLTLPVDSDGWRRAIVTMTVLGPPRALDPAGGQGARTDGTSLG